LKVPLSAKAISETPFVVHDPLVEECVESLENKNTQGKTIQSESCITETERRWKRI